MSIATSIERSLKQTCTYWAASSYDAYGDPVFAAPVTFKCRCETKTEKFINAKGDEEQSRSILYTQTAVAVGGYLYVGTSAATDPETVTGADQIRHVDGTTDIKATTTLYKAFL